MPDRRTKLARLAALHDAWETRWERLVDPDPRLAKPLDEPSQYPETYVDVSCPVDAEAEFQAAAQDALER